MACRSCGLCCQCVRFVAQPDEDRQEWMRFFGLGVVPLPDGRTQVIVPARCSHLDADLRCDDYEHRPAICRDFLCDNARREVSP